MSGFDKPDDYISEIFTGMKFIFVSLLILTSVSLQSYAQAVGIEAKVGHAYNSLHQLRKVITEKPLIATHDYSPGLSYGGTFVVGVDKFETGIDYNYIKSKGIATAEEVGVYLNNTVSVQSIGLLARYPVVYRRRFNLKLSMVTGLNFSSLISYRERPKEVFRHRFMSTSVALTPAIEPVYYITQGFYLGCRAGFMFDFGAKLHDVMDNDFYALHNRDIVRTDWTGLRAEFFIGARMNHN